MKVRFMVEESEWIRDEDFAANCVLINSDPGRWYGDHYWNGRDEYEVEVDSLAEIVVASKYGDYRAESTVSAKNGDEWFEFVSVWDPIEMEG